ncbi:tyrosine-type recombinase/integrase [Streptomyces sp. NPDC052016]|uniref:tyrosine-type recombinase/integrase n=1 Tax=Streptomyces sp. NPDC052016 TaxID=3365680 RepID=UPI0037D5EE73
MADSGARRLSLITAPAPTASEPEPAAEGLADVLTLQRQAAAFSEGGDEGAFFLDTVAEYTWARDVAGLAATTLRRLVQPVIEVCGFYDTVPWRLTPRQVDCYFAGPGKRGRRTIRSKMVKIDGFFAFLEQRYAGEILRRFGAAVESPVDPFNRPRHRGDFGQRIPPSKRAMKEFFAAWRKDLPNARKYPVAVRDYCMAKTAYTSGVRATELCSARLGDIHWELGQWGRFIVQGKGARGSGPREREAYMFAEGRELLWWYVEEIRGEFADDPTDPCAPLWPSERLPEAVASLNVPIAPAIGPDAFRRSLKTASGLYLSGPVTRLYPHLLRHACATHNYEPIKGPYDRPPAFRQPHRLPRRAHHEAADELAPRTRCAMAPQHQPSPVRHPADSPRPKRATPREIHAAAPLPQPRHPTTATPYRRGPRRSARNRRPRSPHARLRHQ